MGLMDAVRKTFGKPSPVHHPQPEAEPSDVQGKPVASGESGPLVIPEVQPADVIASYQNGAVPKLLDCREPFEWRQMRIPGSVHIPMNQIPGRLDELAQEEEWVVVCAHGNRSYAVAGYLVHNGYRASSLAGGVTDWWMRGGETESDFRS